MACPICNIADDYTNGEGITYYLCGSRTTPADTVASSRMCRDQLLADLVAAGTGDAAMDARVNAAAAGEV
jgi:hypothetical protein